MDIDGVDMPERGLGILRILGNDDDPNWRDVCARDRPKYLRERHWIRQWSGQRWQRSGVVGIAWEEELHLADLGRSPDDPGDAFFDIGWSTGGLRSLVTVRTWVEVTEVFQPGQATGVNRFVREYNGLRGKGEIDAQGFLRSLDLGLPDARLQRAMADRVCEAVIKKARKGQETGSYRSLVDDYGRGALIVGLPLWFSVLPSVPGNPSSALDDFVTRLHLGLEAIQRSVLRTNWCPFDSVVVLWSPTLESIDSWARAADHDFYSDPANVAWRTPISLSQAYSWLGTVDRKFGKLDFPLAPVRFHVRWDRYASLNAALADQRRRIRFPGAPRPFGPKSGLEIDCVESENVLQACSFRISSWLFQLLLFVRLHGWHGLRHRILVRLSPVRVYAHWRSRNRLRKLYAEV